MSSSDEGLSCVHCDKASAQQCARHSGCSAISFFISELTVLRLDKGDLNEPLSPRFWNAELELTYRLIKLSTGEDLQQTQFYWIKQLNSVSERQKTVTLEPERELHIWREFLGLQAWETASQVTLR